MNSSTVLHRSPVDKGMSLHRQVFLVLRDEIARGFYPDRFLQNEEALCERFGVSRITVRRALNDLAALGVVERRHGRGTYILAVPSLTSPAPSLAFLDNLANEPVNSVVPIVELVTAIPPADIANLMQLSRNEKAVHVTRIRINRNGEPANLSDVWVPLQLGGRVTKAALKKKAMYEILLEQGVKFGRTVQVFSATVSDPNRAQLLKTDVGAPLLRLERLVHDNESRPVLHLVAHLPANRASVLMETSGASINTLSGGMVILDAPAPLR